MHECKIATIAVHICTVTVALVFNILVIFFLSLSLLLSLSPHSSFFSFDQHQTTATRSLIKSPLITLTSVSVFLIWLTSNHCRWSTCLINIKPLPHEAWSNCRRLTHLFLVVWSLGFRLGGWWFGFRIEWVSTWMGFWSWVGLILNGSPIEVVMMMVIGSEREREAVKKIIKKMVK